MHAVYGVLCTQLRRHQSINDNRTTIWSRRFPIDLYTRTAVGDTFERKLLKMTTPYSSNLNNKHFWFANNNPRRSSILYIPTLLTIVFDQLYNLLRIPLDVNLYHYCILLYICINGTVNYANNYTLNITIITSSMVVSTLSICISKNCLSCYACNADNNNNCIQNNICGWFYVIIMYIMYFFFLFLHITVQWLNLWHW